MFPIRQGATHKVVVGPVVAVGDGFTPVTNLDVSTADEAEVILHDDGTVVDISGYTWAAVATADGYYHLTLAAGISGTVGHMTVAINDDNLCLPVRADFMVLEEAAYDALYAAGALGPLTTKTGFSLAATGLDAVLKTATGAVAMAAAVWDRVLTGATHNISTSAGRRLRQIQDFGIYDMGSVWVDTVAGTSTGTVSGEDGTVANRSDTFANAQTIAAAVGLDCIHIQNGNTIALAGTLNGYNLWSGAPSAHGEWTLALGGQDISLSLFTGASVSGTGTGTTPHFEQCDFGATTVPPCEIENSGIAGPLTLGSAGALRLTKCHSRIAGAAAPIVDMGSGVGASTLEARDWFGGFTLNNLAAGDVVTLDGVFGTITLNGADASVEIRGIYKALVNNLTGSPTVTVSGVKGTDVADILADTGTDGVVVASVNTDAIDATALAAGAVDEILDEVVEGTITMREVLRLVIATLGSKADGMGTTTGHFRDSADSKNRVTVTQDASGNRSAITLDLT